MRGFNRKLLVSVFNSQEAREAILGGGRIIDSEDPKSALGNIKPRQIMAVSDAVLNSKRDSDIQLSTNIGEDQLLFDRSESGFAIEKSPYEIAGKAAQAAIGVACAMGTRVHPCNIVKVGVDGMKVDMIKDVLQEVVITLNRTDHYSHSQVMSVLFAQNTHTWEKRKSEQAVREVLVELSEFHPCEPTDKDAFDLQDFAIETLRDANGQILFKDRGAVSLGALISKGVLPEGSNHSWVKLNELFTHEKYFPRVYQPDQHRTSQLVIRAMVDATAEVGADMIMLDTSILSKVARICLVDTSGNDEFIDINLLDQSRAGVARSGILPLEDIRFFVDYCHYRGIEANIAGSVQSYQAQQLWVLVPQLDQVSTRGAASGVLQEPGSPTTGSDTRQHRVIKRELVRGLAPPEHGGALNIPESVLIQPTGKATVDELIELIASKRIEQGMPGLETFVVNKFGQTIPL